MKIGVEVCSPYPRGPLSILMIYIQREDIHKDWVTWGREWLNENTHASSEVLYEFDVVLK